MPFLAIQCRVNGLPCWVPQRIDAMFVRDQFANMPSALQNRYMPPLALEAKPGPPVHDMRETAYNIGIFNAAEWHKFSMWRINNTRNFWHPGCRLVPCIVCVSDRHRAAASSKERFSRRKYRHGKRSFSAPSQPMHSTSRTDQALGLLHLLLPREKISNCCDEPVQM